MVYFCLRWSDGSQEEEREPPAAPDVEPDPAHAACSCAGRSQREAERQGSPIPDRQSVRVSREALHGLQGTLNLADLHNSLSVPALREDRFSVSSWSESAMSMCHENNVLAVTPTIHSTSHTLCLSTSALLLVPPMQNHLTKSFIKPSLEILCFHLKLMDRFAKQFQCCRGVQGQIKRCQDFL